MTDADQRRALAAGLLYLLTHVTSVAAVAAYAQGAIPLGATLELALAIGCASTGALLFALLREAAPARAGTFASLRAVEAAVILAGALPLVAHALPGEEAGGLEPAMAHHSAAFLVGQGLVIAVNTPILACALRAAQLGSRWLAHLGTAGGCIVLASDLAQLWGLIPLNGPVAAVAAIPIFAFEIWLAVTLLAAGLRGARADTV